MTDETKSDETKLDETKSDETKPGEAPAAAAAQMPETELSRMTEGVIAALKTVYDPEIPADIYELGLI